MRRWFEHFNYYVILGRFNNYRDQLKENWGEYKNIHLLTDVKNISEYMKYCDVAITAGGVTIYELCACGIPSIMYTLADNQLGIARSVSESGVIPWVGDVREDMQGCISRALDYIEQYDTNVDDLQHISQKMQDIVDGKGGKYLVDYLLDRMI